MPTTANGSCYFNGASYLSAADNVNLQPGTSDFTVEAWVYLSDYSSINVLASKADASETSGAGSWYFGTNNSNGRMTFGVGGTDYQTTTGSIVPLGEWCHLAYVRSGTSWTTWLNGVLGATTTLSTTLSGAGSFRIGRGRGTSTNYFAGYISNLRIVIGTALYSSTFTPSTTLTKITNTQLLTCQYLTSDNSISDASDNAFTFTNTNVGTSFMSQLNSMGVSNVAINALDLSMASNTAITDFYTPNADKRLYLTTSDALVDTSVVNPELAYELY